MLLRKFLMLPPLWAFAVTAAAVGIDASVEACRTRTLPPEVLMKLSEAQWSASSLPTHADACALTWAPRVWRALHPEAKGTRLTRARPKVPPLKTLAQTLGLTLEQLHTVRRALDSYPVLSRL